jgi:hypothetical protein
MSFPVVPGKMSDKEQGDRDACVQWLEEKISAELVLCRGAWVYTCLFCRGIGNGAFYNAADLRSYITKYEPGWTGMNKQESMHLLRDKLFKRINELRAQLIEVKASYMNVGGERLPQIPDSAPRRL